MIVKCTAKPVRDDTDIPLQQKTTPRAVRVIKAANINTRRDAPDRPLSVRKVVDSLRPSNIEKIRQNILGGTVKQFQARREANNLHALAQLTK